MVFAVRLKVEEVDICVLPGVSCLSGSKETLRRLSSARSSLLVVLTCMIHGFRFDAHDAIHRVEPR
jgi:hypothetical protein